MTKEYLTTKEASIFLGSFGLPTSIKYLEKLRYSGNGPNFYKWGNKIVYQKSDLIIWIEKKLSVPFKFTSQAIAA